MPVIAVYLDPMRCASFVVKTPNATPQQRLSEPMKDTVEVGTWESVEFSIAVCRIPQQLAIPLIQKVTVKPARTTAQPKPPSGMAVVLNAPGASGAEVVGVGERGGVCVSSSETECLRDW